MKTLKEINADTGAAYQEALRDAKRGGVRGFYRSRGKYVALFLDGKPHDRYQASEFEWGGTMGELRKIMDEESGKFDEIVIHGGIDYAEYFGGFDDGNYEPWVAEWETIVVFQTGGL